MTADAIAGLAGTTSSNTAQAKARAKAEARQEEREQLLAEILDKGFLAYALDLEKKKLEELRRKILEGMGLTEDDLAKMPADQRAAVEKAVALEMQRRLEASHLAAEHGSADEAALQPGFARLDTSLIEALQQTDPARQQRTA